MVNNSKEHFPHCFRQEFQQEKKVTKKDVLKSLTKAFGDDTVSYSIIARWYKGLEADDYSLDDNELKGRTEKCLKEELQALLDENPCRTLEELAEMLEVD